MISFIALTKVFVGVTCLFIGLNLLIRRRFFSGRMLSADGVIVGLDVINEETQSVVVRFTMRNGESREAKVLTTGEYRVGEQVTIFYDPLNPLEVKLQSVPEHWLLPLGFMAVGVLLLLSLYWG
jgi:Protein of unknown function (DUF3592)